MQDLVNINAQIVFALINGSPHLKRVGSWDIDWSNNGGKFYGFFVLVPKDGFDIEDNDSEIVICFIDGDFGDIEVIRTFEIWDHQYADQLKKIFNMEMDIDWRGGDDGIE